MKKILNTIFLCIAIFAIQKITLSKEYESCFGKESTKYVIVMPTSWWGMEITRDLSYFSNDTMKYYCDSKKIFTKIAFYESNDNEKLWRLDMNSNKRDLIMDLNWKVGDTIYIDQEELKQYPNDKPFTTVKSVYTRSSDNRKVITTNLLLQLDDKKFNLKYTEGVGPNISIFLLEYYSFFWKMPYLILCAYKDDVQTYINTEAGGKCTYDKPASAPIIKSAGQVEITVQANELSLDFDDTFSGKLCVISSDGKVLKKKAINRNHKSVAISDLPDGLYIVQVADDTGKYCVHKKITKSGSK
jgi:hypothetical protein